MQALTDLQKSTDTLFLLCEGIEESKLHQPETMGKWSVIQVFNHLIAAEQGSLLYCMKKIQAGDDLEEAPRFNLVKMNLFNWLVRFPIKLKAPSFLSSPSNAESLQEVKERWEKSRGKLKSFIDNYPEKYRSKGIYKHPYAGKVNLNGMLHFFAAHQRHHEIQIRRILKKVTQ